MDGGVDLDVDVVPDRVLAHVRGERDVPMVPEPTGEHVPRPLAETCTSRHVAAALRVGGRGRRGAEGQGW